METCRPIMAASAAGPNGQSTLLRAWPAGLGIAVSLGLALSAGAADPSRTIQGTLEIGPDLAARLGSGDRLIIKLYHPGNGVELDTSYRIVDEFTLPYDFVATPSMDMSGRTKFQSYVIEMFTDRDGDVTSVGPDELLARTPEPVPLGTTDLRLTLEAPDG
jgi:hypothetical protein